LASQSPLSICANVRSSPSSFAHAIPSEIGFSVWPLLGLHSSVPSPGIGCGQFRVAGVVRDPLRPTHAGDRPVAIDQVVIAGRIRADDVQVVHDPRGVVRIARGVPNEHRRRSAALAGVMPCVVEQLDSTLEVRDLDREADRLEISHFRPRSV
jgi:hypothetical protein